MLYSQALNLIKSRSLRIRSLGNARTAIATDITTKPGVFNSSWMPYTQWPLLCSTFMAIPCSLVTVKLPWNKDSSQDSASTDTSAPAATAASSTSHNSDLSSTANRSKAYTPKKGHATPSRKQAQSHPGTFEARFGARESYGESRKKRKELKASMSKEEWKAYKRERAEEGKQRRREAQAAMDRGDERYLLQRDRGEERRYVRDLVDSKRYIGNFVMPLALILLVILFIGRWVPEFASAMSFVALIFIAAFAIEAIVLGRKTARAVRERFPDTSESGFAIGAYAYGRVTQPRRWRTPKPQVNIGDTVA
ncbi:hypothetical membrane protein [Corynebacterium ulcerans]|uniref:Hypothetical membrane protein n=1 Tax=Corynebacterium ulcerans TaxID=65058 RepID=A0ABD7MR05_CORUL|nr:hypothetical membrane protein [Corynebacterium ulcerans]SQG50113.1 hypothetical membrane protein [Corynebacterium ulcerans]SQG59170.1 Protein of uncharacterised function (DUF3043) [Corynebacterium ulcerans]SQH03720.1 hypothetical membrane protein [Corynebacterium ulcerans]